MLFALVLALQTSQPDRGPLKADGPPSRDLSPAHDLYYEDANTLDPAARGAIHNFGACVADRSTALAAETLSRDFTTRSYRQALKRLANVNEGCFRERGRMRSAGLLFAGAIAEKLIEQDRQPLNVRLARAAMRPAPRTYSVSDQVAMCVVRSVPDEAGRLFATDVGGAEEDAALKALAPVVAACSPAKRAVEGNNGGLRAILASAAFRSLNGGAASALTQRD